MADKEAKATAQSNFAIAVLDLIENYREELTEVEIVGVLQLVIVQRGTVLFQKLREHNDDD